MFASLPAVFRSRDETGDLASLLAVLATYFFTGTRNGHVLSGLEQYLDEIPTLFAPLGTPQDHVTVSAHA